MKMAYGGSIRRNLGQLFEGQSVAGMGEAQLLARFVERRDEPAFEALVALHGPMVLGVCRRLLADPRDVEDAFQATFLVLVRRAESIRSRDRLAPWLFGVARKVACRTRTDVARRQAKERPSDDEFASPPDGFDRELNQALLEEIDRLPDSLREPILLCCVEGLSYEAAASRMKSTAPAVRGRLARGRERLRERLNRRGFAPSAMGVAGLFGQGASRLIVPAKLLMMTTQLTRAGTFPPGVEILAEGVIGTMIATKSKLLMGILLTCGVAGSGVGLYAQQDMTRGNPAPVGAPTTPPQTETRMVEVNEVNEAGEVSRRLVEEVTEQTPGLASSSVEASNLNEDDRLDKLERKLDRVLEALEGNSGVRPASRNSVTRATPPQAATNVIGSLDGAPPRIAPPPVPPVPPETRQVDSQTGRPIGVRSGSDVQTVMSRVVAAEQQLGRLEARIVNIERRLRLPNPFNPQPASSTAPEDDSPALQPLSSPEAGLPAQTLPPHPPAPPAPPAASAAPAPVALPAPGPN